MTEEAALLRLSRLCVSAEYCLSDMRKKMQRWLLPEGSEARILQRLLDERFVDENRYAHAFVREKSSFNHWGPRRIEYELHRKGIGEEDIRDALSANINEEENDKILMALLQQKAHTIHARNDYDLKMKLMRFAAQRGFTIDQIQRCIDDI